MKRSRFSDEPIIGILKEQEAGVVTADVCRRHRISEATFYKLCVVDDFTRECLALVLDT